MKPKKLHDAHVRARVRHGMADAHITAYVQQKVVDNCRLVYKAVSELWKAGWGWQLGSRRDAEQEGFIALDHAVRWFRADSGNQFSTYAVTCIKKKILRLCKHGTLVRIPDSLWSDANAADASKNDSADVRAAAAAVGGIGTLIDDIEARTHPFTDVGMSNLVKQIRRLKPNDCLLLALRFGIPDAVRKQTRDKNRQALGTVPMTKVAVGKILCISRQRVWYLETKLLAKLKIMVGDPNNG